MKRRARIVLLGAGMLAACTRFTPAEEEKAEAGTDAAPEGTADATGSTDAATTDGNRDALADDAADAADAGLLGCRGQIDCERRLFVTSMTYAGDLGPLSEFDLSCQQRADHSNEPSILGRRLRRGSAATSRRHPCASRTGRRATGCRAASSSH
jgi:hypothetical protein